MQYSETSDINGTEGVSVLERYPQFRGGMYILGVGKGALFREVSSFQRCLYALYFSVMC